MSKDLEVNVSFISSPPLPHAAAGVVIGSGNGVGAGAGAGGCACAVVTKSVSVTPLLAIFFTDLYWYNIF